MGVPQPILRAIAEKGFKSPTEIQSRTLPAAIMGKKDILGAAETGSGKTLAFGIPLLTGIMELKRKNLKTGIRKPLTKAKSQQDAIEDEELLKDVVNNSDLSGNESEEDEENKEPLYALVLTPTRELAVQVKDHLVAAAKYTGRFDVIKIILKEFQCHSYFTFKDIVGLVFKLKSIFFFFYFLGIKVAAIFGGMAVAKQERVLNKHPEIVVATPGRFWEFYQQDNKHLRNLDSISFLVIDETDRMVEKGHFEELRSILKLINENEQKKQSRQNFVFSATLTLVHDLPEHMQSKCNQGGFYHRLI